MSTIIVFFDGAEYDVETCDVHVGGVDQGFQFKQFVPYLFLEDGLRSNGESIAADEVGFAFVPEIGVAVEEVLEPVFPGLKLAVLVFEHADSASRVDDQHLLLLSLTFRSPSSRDPVFLLAAISCSW
jgi:hypothetical protein